MIQDSQNVLIPPGEDFILPADTEMNMELLLELIKKHQTLVASRYQLLKDVYESRYPILEQQAKDVYKPDNRLVVNFAKYLTDTFNGYFIGIPIRTTHDDDSINEYLQYLRDFNDLTNEEYELAKATSEFGIAYDLIFQDEDGNTNIVEVTPMDTFLVRDTSIRKKKLFGINYSTTSEGVLTGSYSTAENIYYFEQNKDGELVISDTLTNVFGEVPIVEYRENKEGMALYESVYTLMNAYNKALSEKSNDVDYFSDAYMKVVGVELTEEQMRFLRDMRMINVYNDQNPDDITKNIDIDFLSKPSADDTQENLLETLEEKIYQISMVSNVSNESFGSSAGISLAYKLLSMDNLASIKQKKFQAGLKERYRIINNLPKSFKAGEWKNIRFKFTRNAPKNVLEETQVINNLNGIISRETQLAHLSIVDDPIDEMERAKAEQEDDSLWDEETVLGRRALDYDTTGEEPLLEDSTAVFNRENQAK